jgi:hypothetical protein
MNDNMKENMYHMNKINIINIRINNIYQTHEIKLLIYD